MTKLTEAQKRDLRAAKQTCEDAQQNYAVAIFNTWMVVEGQDLEQAPQLVQTMEFDKFMSEHCPGLHADIKQIAREHLEEVMRNQD